MSQQMLEDGDPFLGLNLSKYLLPEALPTQTDLWTSMQLPAVVDDLSGFGDDVKSHAPVGSGLLFTPPLSPDSMDDSLDHPASSPGSTAGSHHDVSVADDFASADSVLDLPLLGGSPPAVFPGTATSHLPPVSQHHHLHQVAAAQQQQQHNLQQQQQQQQMEMEMLPEVPPQAPGGGKAKKTTSQSKKVAHNVIERRYRNNINEKINELKANLPATAVSGPNVKMNKASILRKGIEYIQFLKQQNMALIEDNRALKNVLSEHNIPIPSNLQRQHRPQDEQPSSPGSLSSGSSPGSPSGNSSSHSSRILMGVMLFGLCLFTAGPSFAPSSSIAPDQHASSRVLASLPSPVQLGLSTVFQATFTWWVIRGVMAALLLFLYLREPLLRTESAKTRAALEHEKKSDIALRSGDRLTAKEHAVKAAECLGRPLPHSNTGLFLQLLWQSVQQSVHRVYSGVWLEQFVAARDPRNRISAASGATVAHKLHQILLLEGSGSGASVLSTNAMSALTAINAVNLGESAGSTMDPRAMVDVYVAAAAQMELLFSGQLSLLSSVYLSRAQKAFALCSGTSQYGWLFQPEGHEFFMQGSWKTQTISLPSGVKLAPGSHQQLGLSFRLHLLSLAVREYVTGGDLEVVAQWLHDLRTYASRAEDAPCEWWALMMMVAVDWRRGKSAEARTFFVEADRLNVNKNQIQAALYASFRARQALLDGDQALCWLASERASELLKEDPREPCSTLQNLFCGTRLIALRQLLSTRVALYRLRGYMSDREGKKKLPVISIKGSDEKVDFRVLLTSIQHDIQTLQALAENFGLAEPAVFLYQAIARSLAGGRIALTEHLFQKSLKTAKRLRLPYDEGMALLHTCWHLQPNLTPLVLQSHLTEASSLFNTLQCSDELASARKLLNHVVLVR